MTAIDSANYQKQYVRFPLEADHKYKIVKVGAWEANCIYYNHPTRETDFSLKKLILEVNGCDVSGLHRKYGAGGFRDANNEISSLLGNKFYAQLRAVSRKVWITPIEDILNKYCLYWRATKREPYFDEGQVRRAWKCLDIIKQLEEDGMGHVAPIVIYFVETPSRLKRDLGKSAWKKIANSSLSFNMRLVSHLIRIEDEYKNSNPRTRTQRIMWRRFEEIREDLKFLVSLKKTLVRRYTSYHLGLGDDYYEMTKSSHIRKCESKRLLVWLNKHARVSNHAEVKNFVMIYSDTYRMCKNLNREFRVISPRKMKDYHDKLAKEMRVLRRAELSKVIESVNETMEWLNPYSEAINSQLSNENIKVEVIKDYGRLLDESEDMMHCVADYEDLIADQEYIVVSLESKVQRTTLGLVFDVETMQFHIEQHYGYENESPCCEASMQLAKKITSVCNATYKLLNREAA